MKKWFAWAALLCAAGMMGYAPETPPEDPVFRYPVKTDVKEEQLYQSEEICLPASLWQKPEAERDDSLDRFGAEGYWIELGETAFFAYVGIPDGASAENPVPGVVLIHGGGGTAFADWVKLWNDRGYAAISMSYDGMMPTETTLLSNSLTQKSTRPSGPSFNTFNDGEKPVEEQWAYYTLSTVIASHSFLRSFEGVDGARIGVTGISRGGFLTCLAAGFDDRFAFAIPVYGALTITETWCPYGSSFSRNERANALWNTSDILKASRTPILFICGSNDDYIPLATIARSLDACRYGSALVIQNYPHSHADGARINEIAVFADSICLEQDCLPHLAEENGESLLYDLPKGVALTEATGYYVTAETVSNRALWVPVAGDAAENTAEVSFPGNATYSYVTVTDSRGYRITTKLKAM